MFNPSELIAKANKIAKMPVMAQESVQAWNTFEDFLLGKLSIADCKILAECARNEKVYYDGAMMILAILPDDY